MTADHVRVIHGRQRHRLALDPVDEKRIAGKILVENLDGHEPVQMALPGQKYRAHAACPQQGNQLAARRRNNLVIGFQRLAWDGRAGPESRHDYRRIITPGI